MITIILCLFILIGLFFDLTTCYWELSRNRNIKKPSGFFIVTYLAFYLLPVLGFSTPVLTNSVLEDAVIFGVFHVFITIGVPTIDQKINKINNS